MNKISAILWRDHAIRECVHDSKGNLKPFPILAIDDIPISIWLSEKGINKNSIDAKNLVPAQGWLYDYENDFALENAWKLLKPQPFDSIAISTVLPLLVCPEDLDLTCNVVMVEQVVTSEYVEWLRFGLAIYHIHDVVTSVSWSSEISILPLRFSIKNFEQAYDDLRALDKIWNSQI